MKSQQQFTPAYSCEFFPPRTDEGWNNWREVLRRLGELNPAYFSCTYGAGGTTQAGTRETVREILDAGFAAAAHLTCIGSSREKISVLLDEYRGMGVRRIVALRGDLPEGQEQAGEFQFANELVSFIREHSDDYFHVEVAAYPEMHPQANSLQQDIDNFMGKINAGANAAITQYFFNVDAYYHFIDDCEQQGLSIPVVPGIMPITNRKQLLRFSEMCGAEVPRWIRTRLESYGDDLESIRAFGLDVVTGLCEQLLGAGAPGLHFYTLNKAEPTIALWHNLGLPK
jgi:methylenetetrahydrofolate reductase (NADPH)